MWLTRVQSDSMAPGLRDGQLVWTIRPRRKHRPRRGAVVAVDSSELGRRIVKRIVGLPGEHLRLEGSQVWVDGHLVAEPYATPSTYRGTFDVPEGHYVLLGDNRDASSDSRGWRQPYVARTEIVGVLLPRRPTTAARPGDRTVIRSETPHRRQQRDQAAEVDRTMVIEVPCHPTGSKPSPS